MRVAPIEKNSDLHRAATEAVRLFIAQSRHIEPVRRAHDGAYFPHGMCRATREGRVGEGVTYFGPLRSGLGRKGRSENYKYYHKEIDLKLDDAKTRRSLARGARRPTRVPFAGARGPDGGGGEALVR